MNRVIFLALATALTIGFVPGQCVETLTLLDCLRETATHNALIIQKRRDLERASGSRLAFRSRALPSFSINGIVGQQGERNSEVLSIPAVRDASGQIIQPARRSVQLRDASFFAIGSESLSQPIFDAGIPAAWRRGGIEESVAKANFAAVAATQLNVAHTLFLQALFQQQNGVVLREINASQESNAQDAADLVKAGVADRQRGLAAQLQAANSQPSIIAAAGNYRSTVARLLHVMGRFSEPGSACSDPVNSITLSGTLGDLLQNFNPAEAAREALERRPDLAALRETVRQIKEDANVARGGFYPLLTIYVDSQVLPQSLVNDRPNSVRPDDNTRTTEARPGVREDWTIIDTGAVSGNVHRIEFLREGVEVALRQAEQMIPTQLAVVRANWTSARKQTEQFSSNLSLSADSLKSVRGSLAQGLVTQSDFLDAQNGVAFARSGLLAAQLQASLARAEYDRVTGGYLRFVTDPQTVSKK